MAFPFKIIGLYFKKSQNHFCVATLIARRVTTFGKAYFLTSYLLPKNRPCDSHPIIPIIAHQSSISYLFSLT